MTPGDPEPHHPIPEHVVFDTVAAIYYLNNDPRGRWLGPALEASEAGRRARPVMSAVSVTELLVRPLRDRDSTAELHVRLFLDLCDIVAVDTSIAERAALIRARHPQVKTPDALIAATSRTLDRSLVGNDAVFKRIDAFDYIHLDDLR